MRRTVSGRDDREALPVDGFDVREVCDADDLRRFFSEWHASSYRRTADAATGKPRAPRRGGKMRT